MKEYILTKNGTLAADRSRDVFEILRGAIPRSALFQNTKVLSTRVKTFFTGGFESDWEQKTGEKWQEWRKL